MRLRVLLATLFVAVVVGNGQVNGQLYWDINGTTDGAGGATPSGTWDAATANWNSDPSGGAAGFVTTWDGLNAAFSAGSDATGAFNVTVDGSQNVSGLTFEEGSVTLTGGQLSLTANPNNILVNSGASATINSVLAGVGFNKTGDSTLTLGGDNLATLTGIVNINGGKVIVPAGAPLGVFGNTTDTTSAGTTANNTTVNAGATLEISGAFNSPDMLFLAGDGVANGGVLRKVGNNNTVQKGGIRIRGTADYARIVSTEGTLWLASTGAQSMQREFGSALRDVIFDGPGNIATTAAGTTVDSVSYSNYNIAIGTSRVIKEGTGTLTLNGVSSYTGGTIIRGGVVAFASDAATGSQRLGTAPAAFDEDNVIINGGTLRNTNASSAGNFVTALRGIQVGPNGGAIDYASSGTGTVSLFPGTIGKTPDATVGTLTKVGTLEIRMSAANQVHTFDKLVIKSGIYGIGQSTTLGQDTQLGAVPVSPLDDAVTIDGGILRFLGGTSSTTIVLNENRGFTLNPTGGSLQVEGSNVRLPGKISGGGVLTKTSSQSLIISGDNTYTGGTTVSAGGLFVNNLSGSGTGTGAVTVNGSSTLGGTGTISGAVTMNATSHLAPGMPSPATPDTGPYIGGSEAPAAGTLTVGSVAAIASGASLDLQLGGLIAGTEYDRLAVTGSAALGGILKVSLFNGFTPALGDAFQVLTAGTSVTGTFASTTLPTLTGAAWQVNYLANAVELKVVTAGLAGDYDNNGVVDAADYVVWRQDPAAHGGDPAGYNTWRANFGKPGSGGSGSLAGGSGVPEPSALVLLLLSAAGVLVGRRAGR
jgi:autotransporter-associated beta strand protein